MTSAFADRQPMIANLEAEEISGSVFGKIGAPGGICYVGG